MKKNYDFSEDKFFIAGHNCIVGFTMVRKLSLDTSTELVLASRSVLDLLDSTALAHFFDG